MSEKTFPLSAQELQSLFIYMMKRLFGKISVDLQKLSVFFPDSKNTLP